jgi:hypothetical protein
VRQNGLNNNIKTDIKGKVCKGVDFIQLAQVRGLCKHRNEHFGSIKGRKIPE